MSLYFVSSSELVAKGKDGYIIFTQQSEIDGNENIVAMSVLQFEEICRQQKLLVEESLSTL